MFIFQGRQLDSSDSLNLNKERSRFRMNFVGLFLLAWKTTGM